MQKGTVDEHEYLYALILEDMNKKKEIVIKKLKERIKTIGCNGELVCDYCKKKVISSNCVWCDCNKQKYCSTQCEHAGWKDDHQKFCKIFNQTS